MLTPTPPGTETYTPGDIFRRASARDFLDAVNSYAPGLELTEDQAIAMAYLLAAQEGISPANGARVRRGLAAGQGHAEDDLADLLALGYVYLFPMLTPDLDSYVAEPEPVSVPASRRTLRSLFTRRR